MRNICLCILCVFLFITIWTKNCNAETSPDSIINEYDYSKIDETIDEYTDYHMDFKKLIQDIIGNNGTDFKVKNYINKIVDMLMANKKAMVQIIIIGVLSAVLKTFSMGTGLKQLNETSQMVLSITLISILMAVFAGAVLTVADVFDALIQFYKSICPIFFPVVVVAGGSVSAAAYYQIVIMMIGVVNIVFKNILLKLNSVYMLFGIADSLMEEKHYSKACELVHGIIKYVSKTTLVVLLGLNGIKGMIIPFLDSEKNNILYRTLSVIPGVGNTAMAVSKTILGAGTIVKNSIGVAAILAIIMLSAVPLLKLIVLVVLYKIIAALIEPVAEKSVVVAVNHCSKAIGNLLQMLIITIALLIITIGMICIATNVNYST